MQEYPEPKKRIYELRMAIDMEQMFFTFSASSAVYCTVDLANNKFAIADPVYQRQLEQIKA